MIRMILTAATVLAATATAGFAADLPAKTAAPALEEPPVIPVFSWTGFEAGVHAGYEIGRDTSTFRSVVVGGTTGFSPNGVIGGLHAGYNRAFPGLVGAALVVGIEGDVDGARYQRTSAPFGGVLGGSNTSVQSDVKGSIRGRLGVGVNRVLYYATGGAAFASFDTRFNGAGTISSASGTADRVQAGYTVGGGVEYAFMNYMTVRAEYRYSDYGTFTDTLGGTTSVLNPSIAHRETDNRLQAGLSYKFDSIAP